VRTVAILGSTGSVGRNALEIVRAHPEAFRVTALATGTRFDALVSQVREFRPALAAIASGGREEAALLRAAGAREGLAGPDAALEVARRSGAAVLLNALVGAAGLLPSLGALEAGSDLALANKESAVLAGPLLTRAAARAGRKILPVDSEHSGLFQCLEGARREEIRRVVLTASGGPFLRTPLGDLARVTPAESLRHPVWPMGARITVDSATLLNKGLEVLEAHALFEIPLESIEVWIHPQSTVHALVELTDGALLAHLGRPDMKMPIQYALSWPDRLDLDLPRLRLPDEKALTFEEVDPARFPCFGLALEAARIGGTAPAVLNAADEVAVEAFLAGRAGFLDIPRTIETVLRAGVPARDPDVAAILAADREARGAARRSLGVAP
jgi:1-deoxy-D-xylulose-5-phosphate reductoisomerase